MDKKLVVILRSAQQGGVENHTYDILKQAIDLGYSATLISLASVPVSEKFKRLDIEIIKFKDSIGMSPKSLANIFYLYKVLRDIRPDLVHCHGTRPIFIGTLAARLAGIKCVVITVHNSYKLMAYKHDGRSSALLTIVSMIMHSMGFILSNRIIFVSDTLRNEMLRMFRIQWPMKLILNDKTKVIHNAVDADKYRPLSNRNHCRESLDISVDKIIIGYVGRLDPQKGLDVLIEAFAKLAGNYDIELIIVGDGYYKEYIEADVKEKQLKDQVRLLGHIDDPVHVYNAIDIFVLPSISEGLSLVMLEAMACGTASVITDVGAAREVIENEKNGIIVPAKDVDALVASLENLLNNEEYRKIMSRNARKIILERFTKTSMLQKTMAQYQTITL